MDESGLGEDFTPDKKIGAFIVSVCFFAVLGLVIYLVWG